MTINEYTIIVGVPPIQDDLYRVNCHDAGKIGHDQCGWCVICNKPMFLCTNFNEHRKTGQFKLAN